MGGFLTTLTRAWNENPADPAFESKVAPGMPLQVLCYERADDIASGVSGVVTRAQGIRASFPDLNLLQIPMAAKVTQERMSLPAGSHRSQPALLHCCDAADRHCARLSANAAASARHAFHLPWTPPFLHKGGGLVMSIGQFNQWVGSQLMASGWCRSGPECRSATRSFRGNAVEWASSRRPGSRQARCARRRLHGWHGCTCASDGRGRWSVRSGGPRDRPTNRDARRPCKREWALGMKMVIELPAELPPDSIARHRLAYLRLSRAGNFRLPLCAS